MREGRGVSNVPRRCSCHAGVLRYSQLTRSEFIWADRANSQSSSLQNSSTRRRVLIVGGVAGGASCAARLRRLDESVEIVVFDRGPYVSFANCGCPHYVGDVIVDERSLLVASPELFRDRFRVEVRVDTEVIGVDRGARRPRCATCGRYHLVGAGRRARALSGRGAIRPPCPATTCPASSRSAPSPTPAASARGSSIARHARGHRRRWLHRARDGRTLVHRGLSVTVVDKAAQLMPPLDPEVAVPILDQLGGGGRGSSPRRRAGRHRRAGRTARSWCGERRGASGRSGRPRHRVRPRPRSPAPPGSDRIARRHRRRRADAHVRSAICAVGDVVECPTW